MPPGRMNPDGKTKLMFLASPPEGRAPTAAELAQGCIDLSASVVSEDFSYTATPAPEYVQSVKDIYEADLTFEREYEECPCCGEPDYQTWDMFRPYVGVDPAKPAAYVGVYVHKGVPQVGDIISWYPLSYNPYGHVEIRYRVVYRKRKPLFHNGGRPRG